VQEEENNEELIVTNWDVEQAIKSLKNGKAPGSDDIKSEIYKENKDILTPYLVRLFRECLEEGIFPNSWKMPKLVILLKGEDNDRTSPKSYGHICLLNVVSKIFEKVIAGKINNK